MAVKVPLAPLGGFADLDRPCALTETSGMAGAGEGMDGEEDVDPIAALDVEVLVWARRRAWGFLAQRPRHAWTASMPGER